MAAIWTLISTMVLAPTGAWIVRNGLTIALKLAAPATLAVSAGLGWATGTPWIKAEVAAIAVSAVVTTLELSGSLEPAGR